MEAMYHTDCPACGEHISPGDDISIVVTDSDATLKTTVHTRCAESGSIVLSGPVGISRTGPEVMPRGKSKKDMCLSCFQVPSNNGLCGCDS